MAEKSFVLERDSIEAIRRALLTGLAAYGEVERLTNQVEVLKAINREVPEGLQVQHPTGSADTVREFAEALRMLEYADEAEG
ncbi:MAG TPA: hypothetical protein VEC19_16635 [Usitatibacter sp.]|nr:hypothetical protein [Usitatibacter sp.]